MPNENGRRTVGYLEGAVSVILLLMLVLVSGMGYSIITSHKTDIKIVQLTSDVKNNHKEFLSSRIEYTKRLVDLEGDVAGVTIMCCEDPQQVIKFTQ